jgi:hypothetical protein
MNTTDMTARQIALMRPAPFALITDAPRADVRAELTAELHPTLARIEALLLKLVAHLGAY